ncbi:MAG: hypothetical protein ACKVP7_20425 [Hyphomicrobiaceae bacterium]
MHLAARILPALSVLLLAVAGVLPWGQDHDLRFCLPALAFMGIHFWQHDHPKLVPPAFVAVVGLGIDVLTFGPLGFWPLVFLAGLALTWTVDWATGGGDGVMRWAGFVAATMGLSTVAWLVASAYVVKAVDWRPMVVSVLIQSALYPLAAVLLRPIERTVAGPRVLVLERQR